MFNLVSFVTYEVSMMIVCVQCLKCFCLLPMCKTSNIYGCIGVQCAMGLCLCPCHSGTY